MSDEAGPIAWVEASLVIAIIIRRKIMRFTTTTAAGTTKKEHKKCQSLRHKLKPYKSTTIIDFFTQGTWRSADALTQSHCGVIQEELYLNWA